MTDVNLQELLAPTWVARVRADDSLWRQLIVSPDGAVPPGILAQIPTLSRPIGSNFTFATYALTTLDEHQFIGRNHAQGEEIHYRRVPDGTQP